MPLLSVTVVIGFWGKVHGKKRSLVGDPGALQIFETRLSASEGFQDSKQGALTGFPLRKLLLDD